MDVELFNKDSLACLLCPNISFNTTEEFANHLRNNHCSQEGGSFVCLYGDNQVCSSLPIEGVNATDYERHIYKQHILIRRYQRHKRQDSIMSSSDQSTDGDKWNIYSASQNLAAILNNPNKIKQKDFFTKQWGEGFIEISHVAQPSYLPAVTKQNFEPYLRKVLKRYRRRSKLQRANDNHSTCEMVKNLSSVSLSSLEKTSLDIPDIFLETKFDLSCADTFNFVFPHIADYIRPGQSSERPNKSSPSNRPKLLQERLSHYLDIVEVQIAKQVSSKSDAFFHTMTSHDALMENLGQTITKVRTLRSKIQSIDKSLVTDSLKILKGIRSRNNYCLVLRKLKIMATVYQTQPTVKLLLSTPDYVAALDLIYTTKHLLNNELAGVQCFRHLSSELNEVIKMIDALMTGELERYATADLNRPLTELEVQTLEKDKLLCIIMGMLRRQCFSFVDCYWRESYAAIKATIKQAVIEIVAESDSPIFRNGSEHLNDALTLDEQLKLLTVEEWVTLLKSTASSLIILLRRIKSAYDVMIKAVKICSDNGNESSDDSLQNSQKESLIIHEENEYFLDEENLKIVQNKLSHLITSACQYISERYAHLLSKRSLTDDIDKPNGKYSNTSKILTANSNWLAEQATLAQLNAINGYVEDLCQACQILNPSDSVPIALKSAFKTEATKFMKKFHEERLKKIDMILENESWKQTQVPVEFQSLVNQIFESGKFTTYKAKTNTKIVTKPADVLLIGDEKFVVIGTVLLLINVIAEYCVRAEDITLSAKCLLRYLAELLQLFNRKSCKLVLGGEALSERTGLKKITTSNLALLMRALQLLLRLVPQIKNHFKNLLNVDFQQAIGCLERVSDELHLHVNDISVKMLSILSQSIATDLKNWEAKPPIPSKAFQNLSKNLRKLHEAISGILTEKDVHNLYRKINANFKDVLRERIIRMNIVNDGGPQHGVVTTELFFYLQDLKKVGALPENELNETSMNDLWLRADYWKSQARKYCDFCKCWISDNKPSVQFHENGKRHKANVEARIRQIGRKSIADQKAKQYLDREIRKMEAAAMKAYERDVAQTLDISSRVIRGIPESAPVNTSYVPRVEEQAKWHEARAQGGKIYYWNATSGESRWDRPSGPIIPLPEKDDKGKGKRDKGIKRKPDKKFDKPKRKKSDDEGDNEDEEEEEGEADGETKNDEKEPESPPPENFDMYMTYPTHNGIGCWQPVQQTSFYTAVETVPEPEPEPELDPIYFEEETGQIEFKEKCVSSLIDDVDSNEKTFTSIQFKKRKVNRGNARQRSDNLV